MEYLVYLILNVCSMHDESNPKTCIEAVRACVEHESNPLLSPEAQVAECYFETFGNWECEQLMN